jgi:hypothetical protein
VAVAQGFTICHHFSAHISVVWRSMPLFLPWATSIMRVPVHAFFHLIIFFCAASPGKPFGIFLVLATLHWFKPPVLVGLAAFAYIAYLRPNTPMWVMVCVLGAAYMWRRWRKWTKSRFCGRRSPRRGDAPYRVY